MNSIVLNPAKAACEIFHAFNSFVLFTGNKEYILCGSIGNEYFYWEVCEYVFVPEGYGGKGVGKKVFSYIFSREHALLRSSDLGDHRMYFQREFMNFHQLFITHEDTLVSLFSSSADVVGLTYDQIIPHLKGESRGPETQSGHSERKV